MFLQLRHGHRRVARHGCTGRRESGRETDRETRGRERESGRETDRETRGREKGKGPLELYTKLLAGKIGDEQNAVQEHFR